MTHNTDSTGMAQAMEQIIEHGLDGLNDAMKIERSRAPCRQIPMSGPRVATLFPQEKTLLRLVGALLMEISGEWKTGRIYLRMSNEELLN